MRYHLPPTKMTMISIIKTNNFGKDREIGALRYW